MADDAEGREYEWAEEKLHSILVCQFFFRVVLDSAGPLPGIKSGKKYVGWWLWQSSTRD
jgi:hypothetical protein